MQTKQNKKCDGWADSLHFQNMHISHVFSYVSDFSHQCTSSTNRAHVASGIKPANYSKMKIRILQPLYRKSHRKHKEGAALKAVWGPNPSNVRCNFSHLVDVCAWRRRRLWLWDWWWWGNSWLFPAGEWQIGVGRPVSWGFTAGGWARCEVRLWANSSQ